MTNRNDRFYVTMYIKQTCVTLIHIHIKHLSNLKQFKHTFVHTCIQFRSKYQTFPSLGFVFMANHAYVLHIHICKYICIDISESLSYFLYNLVTYCTFILWMFVYVSFYYICFCFFSFYSLFQLLLLEFFFLLFFHLIFYSFLFSNVMWNELKFIE